MQFRLHLLPRRGPRSDSEAADAPRGRDVRGRDRAAPARRPRVRDPLGEIHGRRTAHPAGHGTDHRSFGPATPGCVDDDERLDPAAFRDIRKGELAPVLRGIQEALRVGLKPVKLNMVVFKQTLPHIPRMIEYISGGDGLKLQLIQFMPELVGQQDWMVDIDALKKWLEGRADKILVREMHHRRIYLFNGSEVEVVDPVYNAEFCMNCHRIRVTHQGELKGCLNRNDDLIPTRGLDDEGLREAFRRVVANRVPYYGAYVKEFPRRDPRAAVPIEFPGVPAG